MTQAEDTVPEPSPNRGRLLIVLSAVLWSTSGLFAQAPIFDNWPLELRGTLLAFWRTAFAALVLLPLVRRPRWRWGLVPFGLTFLAMNVTVVNSLVLTSAANAIWLQYTAPLWVFVVSALWLREWITRDWLQLACGMAGVGLILGFGLAAPHRSANESLGVVYGLLSGIFFGGVVLSLRLLRQEDSAWLACFCHGVTAFGLLPAVVNHHIWPSGSQWFWLAGFGVFQMGLPYLIFAQGLRSIQSHKAAGISLIEPLLVPLWVWLAWHQSATYKAPQWWTFVGGALILVGLALQYARLKPARSGPRSNS
ncbi:MAG: DMT family transporter [Planctomycetia bacterium]|nr:DMT family transporter [Planctomycetia bacterium]